MTTKISINGMICSGCANRVQKALIKQAEVINAEIDLPSGIATIEHQGVEVSSLKKTIEDTGYSVFTD